MNLLALPTQLDEAQARLSFKLCSPYVCLLYSSSLSLSLLRLSPSATLFIVSLVTWPAISGFSLSVYFSLLLFFQLGFMRIFLGLHLRSVC